MTPGLAGSGALRDVAEPDVSEGEVLVAVEAVGVCGTDREILAGKHGSAPECEVPLEDFPDALAARDGDVQTLLVL